MVNNKILKAEKESLESEFYDKIPAESDLGQRAAKHIATVKETTYQDTKRRHLQKLQNLADKTAAATKKCTKFVLATELACKNLSQESNSDRK